jgi:hypothetical protein
MQRLELSLTKLPDASLQNLTGHADRQAWQLTQRLSSTWIIGLKRAVSLCSCFMPKSLAFQRDGSKLSLMDKGGVLRGKNDPCLPEPRE